MRLILALFIATTISMPVSARAGSIEIDDAHAVCDRVGKAVAWDRCIELVPAILDRHRAGQKVERFRSCPPDDLSDNDIAKGLRSWLESRPFNIRYSAVAIMSGGLWVLHPCDAEAAGQ